MKDKMHLFERGWRKVEPTLPMLDPKSRYSEWSFGEYFFFGHRHDETQEKHGIVRELHSGDPILEATYKSGKLHGLSIEVVHSNKVRICLQKNDAMLAYFYLDAELNATKTWDPERMLEGW